MSTEKLTKEQAVEVVRAVNPMNDLGHSRELRDSYLSNPSMAFEVVAYGMACDLMKFGHSWLVSAHVLLSSHATAREAIQASIRYNESALSKCRYMWNRSKSESDDEYYQFKSAQYSETLTCLYKSMARLDEIIGGDE